MVLAVVPLGEKRNEQGYQGDPRRVPRSGGIRRSPVARVEDDTATTLAGVQPRGEAPRPGPFEQPAYERLVHRAHQIRVRLREMVEGAVDQDVGTLLLARLVPDLGEGVLDAVRGRSPRARRRSSDLHHLRVRIV